MTLTFFDPALEDLQGTVPQWWNTETGELALMLTVIAEQIDELSEQAEAIRADMVMATASVAALLTEWAVLYGAQDEQLPPTVDQMRAYLQARAGEDGSIDSLEAALLALLSDPINGINPGSTGLTFPVDGSGLLFPIDGSGLLFPVGGWLEVRDHPNDYTLNVYVRDYLVFDRSAFARAVVRHRPAHYLPPVITETPDPEP